MAEKTKTVITLICERAADIDDHINERSELEGSSGVKVVKFPCSGMIQPNMVEAALKAGASGVIVCGCQIGDCYYREGNKMIKERLLGSRPPTLKKADRRRILALWLARYQTDRFIDEAKDFVSFVANLDETEGAPAPAPAKAKPQPKPAPPKDDAKKEAKPAAKKDDEKTDTKAKPAAKKSDEKTDAKDKPAAKKSDEKTDAKDKPAAKKEDEKTKAKPAAKKDDKKTDAKAKPAAKKDDASAEGKDKKDGKEKK